jgi:hypothetical protein
MLEKKIITSRPVRAQVRWNALQSTAGAARKGD